MAPRRTLPTLIVVCFRAECSKLVEVRSRYKFERRRFCSHRCATLSLDLPHREAGRLGGQARGRQLRRQALAGLEGMTLLEAFRKGYIVGLNSKIRQLWRRYYFVPRSVALPPAVRDQVWTPRP